MVPEREGEVVIVAAPEVQTVGVRELLRVSVGRRECGNDELALADPLSADLAVLESRAIGELDGTLEAQEFVDGAADEPGIVAQPLPLARVGEQREYASANRSNTGSSRRQTIHWESLSR